MVAQLNIHVIMHSKHWNTFFMNAAATTHRIEKNLLAHGNFCVLTTL